MVDHQVYRSYIDTFQAYHQSHTHVEDFYTDLNLESKASNSKSDEDPKEEVEERSLVDFEAFTR